MRCLAGVRSLSAIARRHAQSCYSDSLCSIPAALQALQADSLHQPAARLDQGPACRRSFASEQPDDQEEIRVPGNPRVDRIVEEILGLNLLEVADLNQILCEKLNIKPGQFGMPPGGMQQTAAAPAAPAAAAQAPEPEKTEFDVKLASFDAAAKIKVIKEIRAITSLGLKEAKELVEKAPVVIKAGVSKAEAEEMQKKVEAAGGKVALE